MYLKSLSKSEFGSGVSSGVINYIGPPINMDDPKACGPIKYIIYGYASLVVTLAEIVVMGSGSVGAGGAVMGQR